MSKRISTALFILITTLLTQSLHAESMRLFRIGTGSAGGTFFPVGGIIATAISNPPGSRPCSEGGNCGVPGLVAIAQSTEASVSNANAIQDTRLEAGLVGSGVAYFAYTGTGAFQGKPKPDLRVISNLYAENLHLVLPKGNKLHSIADLKGKRVGIAEAGSGTQVVVEILLKQYGIDRRNIEAAELDNNQSAEYLSAGLLDAYFYVGGTPIAAIERLDNSVGMDLYSWTEEEIETVLKALPYYAPTHIAANTYPTQSRDVRTIGATAMFLTHTDQDEQLIYDITKALWSKTARTLLDTGHPKGKDVTIDTALIGLDSISIPLHPGAKRYYKEMGLR